MAVLGEFRFVLHAPQSSFSYPSTNLTINCHFLLSLSHAITNFMDYQFKGFQVLEAEIQLTETSVMLAQNPEVERFYSWYIQGSIFYDSLPSITC